MRSMNVNIYITLRSCLFWGWSTCTSKCARSCKNTSINEKEVWDLGKAGYEAITLLWIRDVLPRGQGICCTHTKSKEASTRNKLLLEVIEGGMTDQNDGRVARRVVRGRGMGWAKGERIYRRKGWTGGDYLREATCRLAHSHAKTAALRNFLFAYLR
jgi:hypothetical protein